MLHEVQTEGAEFHRKVGPESCYCMAWRSLLWCQDSEDMHVLASFKAYFKSGFEGVEDLCKETVNLKIHVRLKQIGPQLLSFSQLSLFFIGSPFPGTYNFKKQHLSN